MMMMISLVFGENSDYGSGDDHIGDVNTCKWAQGSRLPGTPVWIRLKMNHHINSIINDIIITIAVLFVYRIS